MPPEPRCADCCRTVDSVGALWMTALGTLRCDECHRKYDPDPADERR